MKKVKVNARPIASHYQGTNEKIVEFSLGDNGGLISFVAREDGSIVVQIYCLDKNIDITVSYDEGLSVAEETASGRGLYIKNRKGVYNERKQNSDPV